MPGTTDNHLIAFINQVITVLVDVFEIARLYIAELCCMSGNFLRRLEQTRRLISEDRFDRISFTVCQKLSLIDSLHVHHAVHDVRSEEHTSELQSLVRISYAVFCLKKKLQQQITPAA